VRDAERALGPLSVLVNNAAHATRSTLDATAPDDWDAEFRVTLRAAYLLTRAVLPGMAERGRGAVVSSPRSTG
jgi:NAD(P)-dependent dehydrogenase (short-subunit alcohol dehydrogenase family)